MAKKAKGGVNKSEEVRQLLNANPEITAKDVTAKLAEKGIKITPTLFYYVKGQIKGRKARTTNNQKVVAKVAAVSKVTSNDALPTILKVKSWANEVGGMKALKALVDALSE